MSPTAAPDTEHCEVMARKEGNVMEGWQKQILEISKAVYQNPHSKDKTKRNKKPCSVTAIQKPDKENCLNTYSGLSKGIWNHLVEQISGCVCEYGEYGEYGWHLPE